MTEAQKDIVGRFWKLVELGPTDECWLWVGAKTGQAYGDFILHATNDRGRRHMLAHRMSLMLHGINCEGYVAHHVCHRRLCVNPSHLRLMDISEHVAEHHPMIWTQERVRKAILDFKEKHGVYPAATDWNPAKARSLGHFDRVKTFQEGNYPFLITVQRLYGTWGAALQAAGCEYGTKIGRRSTRSLELSRDTI